MRVLELLARLRSRFSFGETSELDELRSRAYQGDATAQFSLGMMYATGDGVPEDDKEAVKWLRLAAEQGDPFAQVTLDEMYLNGEGVPEDASAQSQHNLGVMYDNGMGVPEDAKKEAVKWFRLAADQGCLATITMAGMTTTILAG